MKLDPFSAIQYVTSPLTLFAFLVTLYATYYLFYAEKKQANPSTSALPFPEKQITLSKSTVDRLKVLIASIVMFLMFVMVSLIWTVTYNCESSYDMEGITEVTKSLKERAITKSKEWHEQNEIVFNSALKQRELTIEYLKQHPCTQKFEKNLKKIDDRLEDLLLGR